MASSSRRYTRSNLDPDPKSPLEDPKRILKTRKYKDQSTSIIILRSSSLNTCSDTIVSDIEFDTFHYPLFKSKSDTDLKELVEETYGLNKLVPKSLSQESKYQFWDSSVKEIKRKLDYFEKSPQSNLLDSLKRTWKLSSRG